MKRFFVLLACGLIFRAALAAPQKTVAQKALTVTRDNFVSLTWNQRDGKTSQKTDWSLAGTTLTKTETAISWQALHPSTFNYASPDYNLPTAHLSGDQMDDMFHNLNAQSFVAMAGRYRQKDYAGDSSETMSLTLSDENGVDRTFTVDVYGDAAPENYAKITANFRALLERKFGRPTAEIAVTPASLTSLQLRETGGFANILSEITVTPNEISWARGIAEKATPRYAAPLSLRELQDLIDLLREARIPAIIGAYKQPNLADGINGTLTLTLRGNGAQVATFSVSNYGDKAPPAYFRVTQRLREMQAKKEKSSDKKPDGSMIGF